MLAAKKGGDLVYATFEGIALINSVGMGDLEAQSLLCNRYCISRTSSNKLLHINPRSGRVKERAIDSSFAVLGFSGYFELYAQNTTLWVLKPKPEEEILGNA